ncbi:MULTISPECIES: PIN domain-containing protein [unclassified Brevibacterium]|uniref:PIN domain-containing protein n=1 Tax=unclassified Brevibacterium TaxID=2614124 RepID=UPI0010919AD4|nr:PIN domain-containing protein [Brevibacterium sp. S22]TGD26876.1 type II toxin-antitoxin system VapC family toxin [Brevibacterium sp. S22]
MTVVDTSVLIDVLRGRDDAKAALLKARAMGALHASEVSRLEVFTGMRKDEEGPTRSLLAAITWHPVDERISEIAGELGRAWLPGDRGIDSADLAIAATALSLDTVPLTLNVKHFPMFAGLNAPY